MDTPTDPGAMAGGRIFFSSAGRTLETENEIELVSVGVDIGSSTSHLAFSRIKLERADTRYIVVARELLHTSDILLTPYRDDGDIDAAALGAFVAAEYARANLDPSAIDTGALILTGVAARRRNARALGDVFAANAGKFVAVTAGDALEAVLSAHGSGAIDLSRTLDAPVMTIDIGGGTSKIALCAGGEILDITAVDIGARVVALDDGGRVSRLEPAGARFAEELGLRLALGEAVPAGALDALAQRMADRLFEVVAAPALSDATAALLRLPPLRDVVLPDVLLFSGGVSEFIYGRQTGGFGDLGPPLAAAVLERARRWGPRIAEPQEGIRATVVGAGQYTVQVSGSTIFVSAPTLLPLRNAPVIAPSIDLDHETLSEETIAEAVSGTLQRYDLTDAERPVALFYRWAGSATYRRLRAFCRGVAAGFAGQIAAGQPLVLVGDGDVGGLVGLHMVEDMHLPAGIVSIDGVDLDAFDFIDIGALLPASGAVPVVVKSLVFPTSGALGSADSALGGSADRGV